MPFKLVATLILIMQSLPDLTVLSVVPETGMLKGIRDIYSHPSILVSGLYHAKECFLQILKF